MSNMAGLWSPEILEPESQRQDSCGVDSAQWTRESCLCQRATDKKVVCEAMNGSRVEPSPPMGRKLHRTVEGYNTKKDREIDREMEGGGCWNGSRKCLARRNSRQVSGLWEDIEMRARTYLASRQKWLRAEKSCKKGIKSVSIQLSNRFSHYMEPCLIQGYTGDREKEGKENARERERE